MFSALINKAYTVKDLGQVYGKSFLLNFRIHKLPPGPLRNLFSEHKKNQRFLFEAFRTQGPILKLRTGSILTICISGLPLCRKFLREHAAHVIPESLDLTNLFPIGHLRSMEGQVHKHYRSVLSRGIDEEAIAKDRAYQRSLIGDALNDYATASASRPSPHALIATLNDISTSILIRIFFGAVKGTDHYDHLIELYKAFGGSKWMAYSEERRVTGFNAIKTYLLDYRASQKARNDPHFKDSILYKLTEHGDPDQTLLGNIIVMVISGKGDINGLMRWALYYAAENPVIMDQLNADNQATTFYAVAPAKAFIMEVLRLNQIESLLRIVQEDLIFENYLVPKGSFVWLALWESHKSADNFKEPFEFHPQRFLEDTYSLDEYAPFGLGHHRCPFSAVSLYIGALVIETLAESFTVALIGNGPPVRGRFHYQPAESFTVALTPRKYSSAN